MESRLPEPDVQIAEASGSSLPQLMAIRRIVPETRDTFSMELRPPDDFSFRPGQFNMLYVFGVGEVPISISGSPADHGTVIHTIRMVGAVTKTMGRLRKGDVVGVRGPFGAPWPIDEAAGRDIVIVAGGIGLAPLRSAVFQVLEEREKFKRLFVLYGTRGPEDILFREDLERWRSRFDMEVAITVDRAMGDWRGNVGVVTTLIAKASFDPRNTTAFVCGPEMMMRFTVQEFMRRGVEDGNMYLSTERNMKCAVGLCGHCQYGQYFVCKDGPVFSYRRLKDLFFHREI